MVRVEEGRQEPGRPDDAPGRCRPSRRPGRPARPGGSGPSRPCARGVGMVNAPNPSDSSSPPMTSTPSLTAPSVPTFLTCGSSLGTTYGASPGASGSRGRSSTRDPEAEDDAQDADGRACPEQPRRQRLAERVADHPPHDSASRAAGRFMPGPLVQRSQALFERPRLTALRVARQVAHGRVVHHRTVDQHRHAVAQSARPRTGRARRAGPSCRAAFRPAMTSRSSCRPTRSSPSVGSSRTSRSGSLSRAWASPSRWTMPLLNRQIGSVRAVGQADRSEQLVDARRRSPRASRRQAAVEARAARRREVAGEGVVLVHVADAGERRAVATPAGRAG